MSKNDRNLTSDLTVSITLDDDSTLECAILQIYKVGDKQYIAVQPTYMVNDPEGDVYIYGYEIDEAGAPELTNIEDDEEFDAAIKGFEELLDDMDFFEVFTPDDNTNA